MTDLTGAELALATARVMDITAVQSADTVVRESPEHADRAIRHLEEFRPDQGGAAAWEVLEWVLGHGLHVEMWRDRLDGCTVCWIFDRPGDGRLIADGIGPADGPTDAIAMCRAVVALGEAG